MKCGQIALDGVKTLEENKEFFKRIYRTRRLEESEKWFDKRVNTIARVKDEKMSLNNYLSLMDEFFLIRLQNWKSIS
jgi:hypothetical protein